MIKTVRWILRILPWILLVVALIWILFTQKPIIEKIQGNTTITHDVLLEKAEELGKIELVKYHFKEITEVTREAEKIKFFSIEYKIRTDAKALLISTGEAAGCIDLQKLTSGHISSRNDTVYIRLPEPELCYFKLDLKKTRIYSLETGFLAGNEQDRAEFIEDLYRKAEEQIKKSALSGDILGESYQSAERILLPLFENISGKKVVFTRTLSTQNPVR